MPKINDEEFNRLLAEKKFAEAKALVKSYIDQAWTKEDEGEFYVGLITQYLEMSNKINTAYITELQEAKKDLDRLDKAQSRVHQTLDINKLKEDIDSM